MNKFSESIIKYILIPIAVTLVVGTSCSHKKIKKEKKIEIRGPVKKITEYYYEPLIINNSIERGNLSYSAIIEYNNNQDITKYLVVKPNGDTLNLQEFYFNEDFQLEKVMRRKYDYMGKLEDVFYTFEYYDDNQNLIESIEKNSKDEIIKSKKLTYKDNLLISGTLTDSHSTEEYTFDQLERIIQTKTFDSKGIASIAKFHYNDSIGEIITTDYYDYEGVLISRDYNDYDSLKNLLSSEKKYFKNGQFVHSYTSSFVYDFFDKYNNWTVKLTISDTGEVLAYTQREIEYMEEATK